MSTNSLAQRKSRRILSGVVLLTVSMTVLASIQFVQLRIAYKRIYELESLMSHSSLSNVDGFPYSAEYFVEKWTSEATLFELAKSRSFVSASLEERRELVRAWAEEAHSRELLDLSDEQVELLTYRLASILSDLLDEKGFGVPEK
jgi:hypothetical protein